MFWCLKLEKSLGEASARNATMCWNGECARWGSGISKTTSGISTFADTEAFRTLVSDSGSSVFKSVDDSLQIAVSGVVTNSDILKFGHSLEFLYAVNCRDLVRNVFDHDIDTGKRADLRNRGVRVFERGRIESIPGITEMHYQIGE